VVLALAVCLSGEDVVSNEWEQSIMREVNKLVHPETRSFGDQALWQAAATPLDVERPRPPQLDNTISDLRTVADRIALENINAAAIREASEANFRSKETELLSQLAIPQQAIETRKQQRTLCEGEVAALIDLQTSVGKAIDHGKAVSRIREDQSVRFHEASVVAKRLTDRTRAALDKITTLTKGELEAEATINGAMHFDPITLRQQPPEDMLRNALSLIDSLVVILTTKMAKQEAAFTTIAESLSCPACANGTVALSAVAAEVEIRLAASRAKCEKLSKESQPLDEADHEKILTLSKDLEEVVAADKLRQAAEANLEEQREQAKHVTDKMIGFYKNIPETFRPGQTGANVGSA
jgi:hypothetical protein